jgi:membrane protein
VTRPLWRERNWLGGAWGWLLGSWPVKGFREAEAGNLAAIISFNAMVALMPTILLLVSVVGLVLRQEYALDVVQDAAYWALPAQDARDALDAALAVRQRSGWIGVASLLVFLWIGTGFVNALEHCFNRVYGAEDCGFVCSRRRGFVVVVGFAVLFSIAAVAMTLPTLFVGRRLSGHFQSWVLAERWGQVASYGIAIVAAIALFWLLYVTVPTAGQRWRDVWAGALLAGPLFVLVGQVFPVYLRMAGGVNRYGATFGLVWLLVTWFAILAHILLFGCYVNATLHRRGLRRAAIASRFRKGADR